MGQGRMAKGWWIQPRSNLADHCIRLLCALLPMVVRTSTPVSWTAFQPWVSSKKVGRSQSLRLCTADLSSGAMTSKVKDRPVTAHVFEYTTSFALDPDMHFKYPDKGIVPCQIIFCMKEKNVSSSVWCNVRQPLMSRFRPRRSTRTGGSSMPLRRCWL